MSALISLLLPTRGRPQLAERFLRSAYETAESPQDVEVVIYADDDDQASHAIGAAGLKSQVIVGPRISMGGCNTACLDASSGEIVILANDDVIVRSPGWDRRVRETHASVADHIYLAYPNDMFKGRRTSTFPILSRQTCDLLGEPFPRAYLGAFIDYHVLDVFKRLERVGLCRLLYLKDVVFEHMHYRLGKSKFDATYRARGRFDDDATFVALCDLRRHGALVLARAIGAASSLHDIVKPRDDGILSVLLDSGLPWRWRSYLFAWLSVRRLAARGLIPGVTRSD